MFGIHPHSGIATLTVVINGALVYEDTTGKSGSVGAGGLEWMKAGGGVWHDGHPVGSEPLRAYQLWVALPPSEENAPAESQYIAAEDVQQEGPARVVLGQLGEAISAIRSPPGINYLHVKLEDGQHWRYTPPAGTHGRLGVGLRRRAVDAGSCRPGTLAVFDESNAAIDFIASGNTSFVLGSAIKHPHDPGDRLLLRAHESKCARSWRSGNPPHRRRAARFGPIAPTHPSLAQRRAKRRLLVCYPRVASCPRADGAGPVPPGCNDGGSSRRRRLTLSE